MLLLAYSACWVFVLVYFVYHYSWIKDRVFTNDSGPVMYHVVPALLALSCFASLKLASPLKTRLALLLLWFGVLIYVVEAIFDISSVWFSLPAMAEYNRISERAKIAKNWGAVFDTRTMGEIIAEFRKGGVEAYPRLATPGFLTRNDEGTVGSLVGVNGAELLPLAGISDKTTVLCNESGEYVTYQSDEHGFHNAQGLWGNGRVQIAALGDAFAAGFCVPSDQNFVSLIRRQYPATLNLGNFGDGPLFMLGKIKEYLPLLRPRIVLWFYNEQNDIGDLEQEKKSPLLMRYLSSSLTQDLINRQEEVDRTLLAYIKAAKIAVDPSNTELFEATVREVVNTKNLTYRILNLAALGQLRRRLGFVYGMNRQEPSSQEVTSEATMNLFSRVLLEAEKGVQAWDGRLYFVYLPQWQRYGQPELARQYRARVIEILKELRIPVIDVHSAFLAHGDPLALFPFREYGNYNVEGHRVVAEELLRHISPG